jgi:hemerythrin superfamily protein
MSAIDVLKQDHRAMEQLFGQYQEATASPERKQEIVNQVIRELSVHAAVEEEILYPTVREAVPDGDELAQESLQERHQAKQLLAELDGMSRDDLGFDERIGRLMEDIRHHVEEEEGEFPKLQQALDEVTLADVGHELEEAKKRAPTRPHPAAPDQPPGIKVASPAAALLDRIRDKLQGRA